MAFIYELDTYVPAGDTVQTVASLGRGEGRPPLVTPSRGDTRIKLISLWLSLERTLHKRRGKMRVVRRRQPKKVLTFQRAMTNKGHQFFKKKIGWHHQLPPWVTPTLVTPLCANMKLLRQGCRKLSSDRQVMRGHFSHVTKIAVTTHNIGSAISDK